MNYEKQTLTVGQLNLFIKDLFSQIPMLGDIRIKGEISNFKHHSSGHLYMSLKDETGVVRAVMFKSAAMYLDFKPKDGMQIIAEGRVSVYERDGQYQLYISKMTQDGKGGLFEQFEKLKSKLQAEGLFEQNAKKPIPKYPNKVGIITAPTGAAVRDIINILSRRFPLCQIYLYPALVQGSGAAESISQGVKYFNNDNVVDVLIIGRGGGSIEDLWAFNEESLARTIFASRIPVISAVGHETDFTIADFVADLRAPTPSAAAELAVPSAIQLIERFESLESRLVSSAQKLTQNKALRLKLYTEKQVFKDPVFKINEKGIYLDHLSKLFENAVLNKINQKRQNFTLTVSRLEALSPLGTLSRGYSITKGEDGSLIKSVKQVKKGSNIEVMLKDGNFFAEVK